MNARMTPDPNDDRVRVPGTEYTVELMYIDPKTAQKFLDLNCKNNRKLVDSNIEKIAEDMSRKKWRATHQGIAFDYQENLIDGQHRLTAIVQSGATVPMIVWRNVPTEFFSLTDRGATRSYHTVLNLAGKKNSNAFNSVVRKLTNLIHGFHRHYVPNDVTLLMETIDKYGADVQKVENLCKSERQYMAKNSHFMMGCFAAYQIDPDKTIDFISKYCNGYGLVQGDPADTLRKNVANRYMVGGRMVGPELFSRLCVAIYKHLSGESCSIIRLGGSERYVMDLLESSKLAKSDIKSSWTNTSR